MYRPASLDSQALVSNAVRCSVLHAVTSRRPGMAASTVTSSLTRAQTAVPQISAEHSWQRSAWGAVNATGAGGCVLRFQNPMESVYPGAGGRVTG